MCGVCVCGDTKPTSTAGNTATSSHLGALLSLFSFLLILAMRTLRIHSLGKGHVRNFSPFLHEGVTLSLASLMLKNGL